MYVCRGCFDRALTRVELIKSHQGTYTTVTPYSLKIDGILRLTD
jgi:hypothetical protein